MYLFGGWDGEKALDVVYIYDPDEDAWREGTPMVTAREDAAAVALADRIVILGGRNTTQLLKSTQLYFPSRDISGENSWEDFVDIPQGRVGFGATNINDLVYLFGGEMDREGELGLVLVDDNWVSLHVEEDLSGSQTRLLSIGQLLYVFAVQSDISNMSFWSYQAFYYNIYIPIMP
jgi:hypothetical protein